MQKHNSDPILPSRMRSIRGQIDDTNRPVAPPTQTVNTAPTSPSEIIKFAPRNSSIDELQELQMKGTALDKLLNHLQQSDQSQMSSDMPALPPKQPPPVPKDDEEVFKKPLPVTSLPTSPVLGPKKMPSSSSLKGKRDKTPMNSLPGFVLDTQLARIKSMPSPTSSTSTPDVDLNHMPSVNLPGFTPFSPLSPQPQTPTSPINIIRRLSKKLSRSSSQNSKSDAGESLERKRSMTRPERARNQSRRPRQDLLSLGGIGATTTPTYLEYQQQRPISERPLHHPQPKQQRKTIWQLFAQCITCYCPPFLLKKYLGKQSNDKVQQAWREKMALVTIIVFLWCILGFITFGFEYFACGFNESRIKRFRFSEFNTNVINIRGNLYDIQNFQHPGPKSVDLSLVAGRDCSWLFPVFPNDIPGGSACNKLKNIPTPSISCTVDDVNLQGHCHTQSENAQAASALEMVGILSYTWQDIQQGDKYLIYNGKVLNLDRYFRETNGFLGDDSFNGLLVNHLGRDTTLAFKRTQELSDKMSCLVERFKVGELESQSIGCFASQTFTWTSFVVILGVILARFILATYFNWFKADQLGKEPPPQPEDLKSELIDDEEQEVQMSPMILQALEQSKKNPRSSLLLPTKSRFSHQYNSQLRYKPQSWLTSSSLSLPKLDVKPIPPDQIVDPGILRTILFVACYSEGEAGLRTTLDSLARTSFPDTHKLLFIIADGIITGSGNQKSTPDILIDMLEIDPAFNNPEPYSYVAITEGQKRHNMAKVYAGKYHVDGHTLPAILVVKCGTPEEQNDPKPGNRGKRDSQIILMQFLCKVLFDDRMTPLEYDLFTKMTKVSSTQQSKVTPDLYELVLFVDADTKIMADALRPMSYTMANDSKIMGLCGETRIFNKTQSFITSIQVFEYYISHFLTKSFESVFGGVTCLPGCFCMYRVKAPKGLPEGGVQYYVPILANPDIVEAYSENSVESLHEKNLLLLGEDRYLTTLMLKTFPKRNLVFVPRAVCKTIVPETFSVLLSQRRRWINSTIHNLLELVLVRDLCGIFCFSMQFVIFMELVGTAVLPAAISFTIYLLIISFFVTPKPIIPLLLLAAILGLPALLIMLTSKRWSFLLWMLIYLLSLPIWNFILPVYAFWHFDDFSWGSTRQLEGGDQGHQETEGVFDPSKITMRHWSEWEKERQREEALDKLNGKNMTV